MAISRSIRAPRVTERAFRDLHRLIDQQNFRNKKELDAFLKKINDTGRVPRMAPRNALEEAEELVDEAWDATNTRQGTRLVRRALQLSPDCADAYVFLAEVTARTLEEARDLYARGVAAGERALGPETFAEEAGHFWGLIETRPYMRARDGLARALWSMGEREEAVRHFEEMLMLNPNDNQGVRHTLAACLLDMGRDGELGELLEAYRDEWSAAWHYTWALLELRREDLKRARSRLKKALECNPHVPAFLLGWKRLPPHPGLISPGEPSEAVDYAWEFGEAWRGTRGALSWLAESLPQRRPTEGWVPTPPARVRAGWRP